MNDWFEGEPVVCCDFADPRIDADAGRYYFNIVHDLIRAGYFPVLISHRSTLSTFIPRSLKSLLIEKRLGVVETPTDLKGPFVLLTDTEAPCYRNDIRVVRVDYDERLAEGSKDLVLPYFVHPRVAIRMDDAGPSENAPVRTTRLFFGGNTDPGKYNRDRIRDVYGMLSRVEVLAAAEAAAKGLSYRPVVATEWLASAFPRFFVICETDKCPIPATHWLQALGKADFFLACPGVGMPLSHNLIEAMAAGAVPVLQYPDYLTPPLVDGVNCRTFVDVDSLRALVDELRDLPAHQIELLRAGTRGYYREHLAPGLFAERLAGKMSQVTTLLINACRTPR